MARQSLFAAFYFLHSTERESVEDPSALLVKLLDHLQIGVSPCSALSFEQIIARIASLIFIILSSLSSILLLSLAMASLGDISSSLVTKTCSVLDTSDETVRAKSSDSSEDGSSPGSVWPPGLSYMTTDVARDT
uniref:Uncharacterized protein n=1 Tax=Picea glauca TaxID=3330 RepID=A0A124GNB7_PICGL|nr:hypothetical protein ABT39_MTgene5336 [Picea glauca]QHR88915.1 hypothetical protein Q903MT_gene2934 [Picea sitchensis]